MGTMTGRIEIVQSIQFLGADFGTINREKVVNAVAGIFDAVFAALYREVKTKWLAMNISVKRPFICFIDDINDSGKGLNESVIYSLNQIKERFGYDVSAGSIFINAAHLYYTQDPSATELHALRYNVLRPHFILNKDQLIKVVPPELFEEGNHLSFCLTIMGFLCLELWKAVIPFYRDMIRPEEAAGFAGRIMDEVSVLLGQMPSEYKEQVQKSYGVYASLIQIYTKAKNPDVKMSFVLYGICVACFAMMFWASGNISEWEKNIFSEKSYFAVIAKLLTH